MQGDVDRRDSMFAKYNQQLRQPAAGGGMFGGRFSSTNRVARDPSHGVITAKEWEEMVHKREESGRSFRIVFGIACAIVMLLLVYAKYDVETNLEMPQIEYGTGFGELKSFDGSDDSSPRQAGGAAGTVSEVVGADMEHLYQVLGVEGRLKKPTAPPVESSANDGSSSAKVDLEKQRLRDNYRVRKEVKAAYQRHQEGVGQLVHCGRSCESKNQQVELAYTSLASQIDRPLESVLFDNPEQRKKRNWSPAELRARFQEKLDEIAKTETDEEDRAMAVEELQDAYNILSNNEATTYMRLVGRKPPEYMKHLSQRDGGWAEKLQTGTYKNRLIFAWLDYFDNPWAETALLGLIAVFLLMRLPQAIKQTQVLVDELEWEEQREAAERKAASGGDDQDDAKEE